VGLRPRFPRLERRLQQKMAKMIRPRNNTPKMITRMMMRLRGECLILLQRG
jgi:hypothetical protein